MRPLMFWCNKVLPLVYDDSLSYYEVLCKVRDYINALIEQDKVFGEELLQAQKEIATINQWIANFDTSYVAKLVDEYLGTAIFVQINDAGYITYSRPNRWSSVVFNTTGLDIIVPSEPEYGHLVLSY